MDAQTAIDLTRQAILESLVVVAPVLLCGLLVALVLGLLQALTQIQEQSITFVPKIVAMMLVLGWSLPWVISRLVQYSHDLIAGIPDTLK
ncbi:MAG: flagellar biosynthetic protein FliQ [Planctomycetota bacterium]|nr:MAG: flagellar biosynthetic protein FliQ [Planctomycetota bacterium]